MQNTNGKGDAHYSIACMRPDIDRKLAKRTADRGFRIQRQTKPPTGRKLALDASTRNPRKGISRFRPPGRFVNLQRIMIVATILTQRSHPKPKAVPGIFATEEQAKRSACLRPPKRCVTPLRRVCRGAPALKDGRRKFWSGVPGAGASLIF